MTLRHVRLRTLMIAVAVVAVDLAALVAVLRPVDMLLQLRGVPDQTRVVADVVLGLTLTSIIAIAVALVVQIVRRAGALRSLLRKP